MDNMELNKEHYERMVNLTPDLLSISDMDGHFKYVNPAFETILGYSTHEIMELNLYDLVHPEDMDDVDNSVNSLNSLTDENNQDLSFEYRYRCKDGTYKWIAWNVRIQLEEQLVYSSGHDITNRKRAEIELEKTKKRLQEAQEFAHIGYCEFNTETREYPWSDELFRICGFKPQEFIPTINDFMKMIHPDDKFDI